MLTEAPEATKARVGKSSATVRERIKSDPEVAAFWAAHGKKLYERLERKTTKQERRDRSINSLQAWRDTMSSEELSETSRKRMATARERFPDLASMGGIAAGEFQRKPETRKVTSKRFKKLWEDPEHRAKVSAANSKAAIEGRIPVVFNASRPTELEKRLIILFKNWGIPFRYTGDGSFRIPTPDGCRNWRNPDFIHTDNIKSAILLDSYVSAEHDSETADYANAGWKILRINVAEMNDPEWLQHKLQIFIAGLV
jgi:hypothetical protein